MTRQSIFNAIFQKPLIYAHCVLIIIEHQLCDSITSTHYFAPPATTIEDPFDTCSPASHIPVGLIVAYNHRLVHLNVIIPAMVTLHHTIKYPQIATSNDALF